MAAYEIPSFYLGVIEAEVDLSSSQYLAVKPQAASAVSGTEGASLVLAGAGDPAIGILQNNPLAGEAGSVMIHGVSKAQLGGTVSVGSLLAVDGSGKLVVAASGNYIIGEALMAGVSGDIISVLLIRNGKL